MQFCRMMHRDSQNVLAWTYWVPGVHWCIKYGNQEDSASLRISALLLAVWPPALGSNRFWAPNPALIYWWPHGFQEYYTGLIWNTGFPTPFFYWINLMIVLISWTFLSRKEFFWKYLTFINQIKKYTLDFITYKLIISWHTFLIS